MLYSTSFFPKVDGVALRVRHHIHHVQQMGHKIFVVSPMTSAPDLYEGCPIIKLPSFVPLDYSESKLAYPFPVISLIRIMRKYKPDIVHFVGPEFVFFLMVMICKLFNIPLIGSYHFNTSTFLDGLPAYQKYGLWWIKWLEYVYNLSDFVITPSRPFQKHMHMRALNCNDIWPPAVDAQDAFHPRYRSREMREKLTFGHPDDILILYVGRVAQEKSMDLMLRILDLIPNAWLAIIGTGPQVNDWTRRHGKHNRIYCEGVHWTDKILSEAYASTDIFVIPSAFETLGNVVLEAMASQVAVVGCNAGGIPHMIRHKENGLLFKPHDEAGLAQAVKLLVDQPEYRNKMALSGREYAESVTWEAASKYVVGIYERVLKRARCRDAGFAPVKVKTQKSGHIRKRSGTLTDFGPPIFEPQKFPSRTIYPPVFGWQRWIPIILIVIVMLLIYIF